MRTKQTIRLIVGIFAAIIFLESGRAQQAVSNTAAPGKQEWTSCQLKLSDQIPKIVPWSSLFLGGIYELKSGMKSTQARTAAASTSPPPFSESIRASLLCSLSSGSRPTTTWIEEKHGNPAIKFVEGYVPFTTNPFETEGQAAERRLAAMRIEVGKVVFSLDKGPGIKLPGNFRLYVSGKGHVLWQRSQIRLLLEHSL